MILLADSGGTKTSWRSLPSGGQWQTVGLNPTVCSDAQFRQALGSLPVAEAPAEVHFYGAGCGLSGQRRRVAALLHERWPEARLRVLTDLEGACRAVAGESRMLVGILGTGSNVCLFGGRRIVRRVPSTGFLLGDQGSACHAGRLLLDDALARRLPADLSALFHEAYPLTDAQWLEAVYRRPAPNRLLASLAPFVTAHRAHPYCQRLLLRVLSEWYACQLGVLAEGARCRRVGLVGGFAAALGPMAAEFLEARGLRLERVVAAPIEGLAQWHAAHPLA